MNVGEIEENIRDVLNNYTPETFIYDLLLAYGKPKASIARLQKSYNLSKRNNEIIWPKNLCYRITAEEKIYDELEVIQKDKYILKHNPRFIVITDHKTLLATDTKTNEILDIPLDALCDNYDFFLPWAGLEKTRSKSESLADRKAAWQMAKLYDAIKNDNPKNDPQTLHSLNVFLSRLLFCFFAEDTEIFEKGVFSSSIASHTQEDGSDLSEYLDRLFSALNTKDKKKFPKYFQQFPYVNGGLFAENLPVPQFSTFSRKILLECGRLNWSSINPDIFGSMIQAVVGSSERSNMGMHYTSVPNIMKVIEPLFLDELNEKFEQSKHSSKELERLLRRLYQIKIFDPACGSGNFLIVAYKELRILEMKIFKKLQTLSTRLPISQISVSQFYGIELDDFAHEIAILSLWLIDHQMNMSFKMAFGHTRASLPLKDCDHIICGNATRLNWNDVCPEKGSEVYILGNPPYLGARNQNKNQKEDMKIVFGNIKGYNNLDYISCWFSKGCQYIKDTKSKCAFVTTNSITQGVQVSLLWPHLLTDKIEINFAYQSFKWSNNAKHNAGVACVIIGLRNRSRQQKTIYNDTVKKSAKWINPYLIDYTDVFVLERRNPLSPSLPILNYGSFALDDKHFTLTQIERDRIIAQYPHSTEFIKEFIGAKELIQDNKRYCLWITDSSLLKAMRIPFITERVNKVKKWREQRNRINTKKLASVPYKFAEIRQPSSEYLAIPTVSSERREYIPIEFFEKDVIASCQIYTIPNPQPYVFGIISSRMHMVWVKTIAGRIKTDYRYSVSQCYNTFPFPSITMQQKKNLHSHVLNIISEREKHPEKSLAELYNPKKMPKGLKEAHNNLDDAIDRCYRSKSFENDQERLEYLFRLYEEMTKIEGK